MKINLFLSSKYLTDLLDSFVPNLLLFGPDNMTKLEIVFV